MGRRGDTGMGRQSYRAIAGKDHIPSLSPHLSISLPLHCPVSVSRRLPLTASPRLPLTASLFPGEEKGEGQGSYRKKYEIGQRFFNAHEISQGSGT